MKPLKKSAASGLHVVLLGNPNAGKSTLFNALTGLNQKTGNYSGVTVDKLQGSFKHQTYNIDLIDLPGTYSLFPKSTDEEVAIKNLLSETTKPDVVVLVLDSTNIRRNLLLATQTLDLGMPSIVVLNMYDEAQLQNITIDVAKLEDLLGVKVLTVDSRTKIGIDNVKDAIVSAELPRNTFYDIKNSVSYLQMVRSQFATSPTHELDEFETNDNLYRFKNIKYISGLTVRTPEQLKLKERSTRIDKLVTHRVWGFAVFLLLLLIIFQAIFYVAEYPMKWIEDAFLGLSELIKTNLPEGILTNLLSDGVISGVSGVLMFIPQIAFLFLFIAFLEDSGYMARASFIMDRIMRKFGLNGRSVIPIIGATACAVPSIMSTRSIANFKERLITIFVLPLMSCSARLPVYTLLISMMFPSKIILGFLNLKGLVLLGLYLLGFAFTLITAFALKKILKTKEASFYLMEMPVYRWPLWRNVLLTVYNKVKVFVVDAGKIILAISIVLWFLSNYGPDGNVQKIEDRYAISEYPTEGPEAVDYSKEAIASKKLEASYIGHLGRAIEPVIKPLGYDWKIGIALITSFAAREVFVGTMATIYGASNEDGIQETLTKEKDANGHLKYTLPVCFSLAIFYVFAMQCMSTLAVVRRETKTWKWPIIQFVYLTALAYLSALFVFNILS